jgi:hypothetical protein
MRRPSVPPLADPESGAPRRQVFAKTWRPGPFDYERLDAYQIARDALSSGMAVVKRLPEDQIELKSQLRRALVEAFAGVAATASLTGDTRRVRAQTARAFASEAAALLDALVVLDFVKSDDITPVVALLGRLCAMLSRLGTHTARAL